MRRRNTHCPPTTSARATSSSSSSTSIPPARAAARRSRPTPWRSGSPMRVFPPPTFRSSGWRARAITTSSRAFAAPDRQNRFSFWPISMSTGSPKPILLLAHIDVVEAKREDWSLDPFTFTEKDGFFYGRGTMDIKDGAAILVATLARLKQEGYRPNRDLILALTTGEEGGSDYNGVQWLLENHRDLVDAAYVINMDAGDPVILNGKRLMRSVQASEKVYVTFKLEVHNPGGHSSLPTKDNAIYRLAAALGRVSAYEFPAQLNEITRAFFQRMSGLQQGTLAADMAAVARPVPDSAAMRRLSDVSPLYNAQLHTTCVATQLAGGHAENALPQTASATVNCRMLPGTPSDDVQRALTEAVRDSAVAITVVSAAVPSPPSPLTPEIMDPIERVTRRLWNIPVVPVMETGATMGCTSATPAFRCT